MKRMLIPLLIVLLAGCGKNQGTSAPAPAKQGSTNEKSTLQTVVDGFTGKTAVDAGQRAKRQLQEVSRKENQELEEALGK